MAAEVANFMFDHYGRQLRKFAIRDFGPGKTVQSDAIDADINTIVRRFGITGKLPTDVDFVTNLDLTEAPNTYQAVMDILIAAQNSFGEMPADVRARFNNDPGRFMDFCSDPENLDEMRKLGLAVPKVEEAPEPEPIRVRVIPEDAPESA